MEVQVHAARIERMTLNSVQGEGITFKSIIFLAEYFRLGESYEQGAKQMPSVKSYAIVKNDV